MENRLADCVAATPLDWREVPIPPPVQQISQPENDHPHDRSAVRGIHTTEQCQDGSDSFDAVQNDLDWPDETLHQTTVLIVDDEPAIAALLAEFLEGVGYHVLIAHNGRTGLVMARALHPELVLSDCVMPGVSGPEIVLTLRSQRSTSDIPVVLMSSTRPRLEGLGNIPFLTKPFDLDDVLDLVEQHVATP